MNRLFMILTLVFLSVTQINYANKVKDNAYIFGNVSYKGEHPISSVSIKGTTIGSVTDDTGHYQLPNLKEGTYTIVVHALGYRPKEKEITLKAGGSKEIEFQLEKDVLGIDEVVVTGNRNEIMRKESSTIVNTLTPKLLARTQSVTLGEGLNFTPGLRMEDNCQNCGFSQIRMNGLEGPYSQILINSRPIFSGLAGVYGLEMIPTNMIERIEVVRGGGSALYGGNAIAGTVNLILKDPVDDSYQFGVNSGLIGVGIDKSGDPAQEYTVNFNTSVVSSDNKTGMSLYGFYRDRQPFDENGDDYSEVPMLKNTTIGTRLFHRFGTRGKLTADFFNIKENRRGGDKFEYPRHEADITEALDHDMTTGALTYDQYFRENDMLSIYASGQRVARDSYYGANKSLEDYGKTKDFSYSVGVQYTARFTNSNLVAGIEDNGASLTDKKLGFPDIDNAVIVNNKIVKIPHTDNVIVADQTTNTIGLFSQYEINVNKLKISVGARLDHYVVSDNQHFDSDKSGNVLSPRLTFKYDIEKYLQARVSYSQGYRAPQIYDEDLHVEASGSRRVIHKNSPDLKQETSRSYTASLDFNKRIGTVSVGLLVEGFYTKLIHPFSNTFGAPDKDGTVIYTRVNADKGAKVQGLNMELNVVPSDKFSLKAGFTIQSSEYEDGKDRDFHEKKFLRTPDNYGYMTLDWKPFKKWGLSSTGDYTGKMLVPYFGPNAIPNPDVGELRKPDKTFFDFGLKIRHNIQVKALTVQLFTGMKNIFNSRQTDFDKGVNRDSNYIYGPINPRTIYFGLKIGNFIR